MMALNLIRCGKLLMRTYHRSLATQLLATRQTVTHKVPNLCGIHTTTASQFSQEQPHEEKEVHGALAGFTDYEEGLNSFKLDIPEFYNFSRDVIDHWASIEKQELADGMEPGSTKHLGLWWADEKGRQYKWTYQDLSVLSKRIAYVLTGPAALQKGDRMIVMMTTFPQYWLLYLASIRAGIVMCPASGSHSPAEIKLRLIKSKAKCVFTDHTSTDTIDEIAHQCPDLKTKLFYAGTRTIHRKLGWFNYAEVYKTSNHLEYEGVETRSDDPLMIFFTTGTTGEPKLVEHTQASYGIASVINGKYWYDQTRDDVMWAFADVGWAKLAWGTLGAWHQGSCVFGYHFQDERAFTFDSFQPTKALKILEKFPITTLTTSPPMWRKLVQEDLENYQFSNLRHCFSGGELLNTEVMEKWYNGTKVQIYDGYGQTENAVLCGNFKCVSRREGSLGKPAPGYHIAVIDHDGNEVPQGEHGHIAIKVKPIRPPGLFTKYLGDPVLTAKAFIGDYYITGDKGYVDDDGYFWFISRKDDIIYTSGHVVSPFDIEGALMEHPCVAACAVVSSPDHLQLTGQVIKAFVVLTDDFANADEERTYAELHKHAVEYLKPHEVPQQINFVSSLPTTVTGKLKRADLRHQEWHLHGE